MYSWTYQEWLNRVQGANLAVIDAQERAIHAAWVAGISSRQTKGKPAPPHKYFDADAARKQIIDGTTTRKKQADFTLYDRMKKGLKSFDWYKAFVPKEK
ncbi:hypothetical protein [Metasolibacillus meyeri]|uniref:hypothetical protein n=1 Tax=Metasolibacillus meyeri TaxID=1071052 RepID=UPI000D2FB6DC|nr:hypothetical protein [Metasolibacillus meyeri]